MRSDTQSLACGTRARSDFLLYSYQLCSFVSVQAFLSLSFLISKVTTVFTLPIGFWKDANKMCHSIMSKPLDVSDTGFVISMC